MHCVNYKPSYIKLAKEVHETHPEVEFYAVSCSGYMRVCNDYKVHATPTLFAMTADGEKIPLKVVRGQITAELVKEKLQLVSTQFQLPLEGDTVDARRVEEKEERSGEMDGQLLQEDDDDDNPIDETGGFEEEALPPEPEDQVDVPKDVDEDDNYNQQVRIAAAADDDDKPEPPKVMPVGGETDRWFPEDVNEAFKPIFKQRAGALAVRAERQKGNPVHGEEYLNAALRQHLKQKLQAEHQRKGRRGPKAGFSENQNPVEGDTLTMKAHQKDTQEFKERRDKILAHIEKRNGKRARQKVEKQMKEILERKDVRTITDGKAKLPYRKNAPNRMKLGERIPLVRRAVKMSTEESLILDTLLSFMSGLKTGLFRKGTVLENEEKLRLKDWLQLLSVALPQEWGIHDLISELLRRLPVWGNSRGQMMEIFSKYAPRRASYSPSCRQTKIPFNCGFWKLLHTITVGIAEHKGGLSLIDDGTLKEDARTFSPAEAADVIRNYMDSFFPCPTCSKHFVQQYDDCDNLNRCIRLTNDEMSASGDDWKELAKWMWEFHNSVSVGILHTKGKSSVADQITVLWPTVDSCIRCFDNEGGWNEDAVFLHLEAEYWPGSDPDPQTARLLRLERDMMDPTGSGLTLVLVGIGFILFYMMRQSLSKDSIQRAILVAKNVRSGAAVGQKRKD